MQDCGLDDGSEADGDGEGIGHEDAAIDAILQSTIVVLAPLPDGMRWTRADIVLDMATIPSPILEIRAQDGAGRVHSMVFQDHDAAWAAETFRGAWARTFQEDPNAHGEESPGTIEIVWTEASCSGNVCPPSNPAGFIHLEPKGIRHRPTNRERLGTEDGSVEWVENENALGVYMSEAQAIATGCAPDGCACARIERVPVAPVPTLPGAAERTIVGFFVSAWPGSPEDNGLSPPPPDAVAFAPPDGAMGRISILMRRILILSGIDPDSDACPPCSLDLGPRGGILKVGERISGEAERGADAGTGAGGAKRSKRPPSFAETVKSAEARLGSELPQGFLSWLRGSVGKPLREGSPLVVLDLESLETRQGPSEGAAAGDSLPPHGGGGREADGGGAISIRFARGPNGEAAWLSLDDRGGVRIVEGDGERIVSVRPGLTALDPLCGWPPQGLPCARLSLVGLPYHAYPQLRRSLRRGQRVLLHGRAGTSAAAGAISVLAEIPDDVEPASLPESVLVPDAFHGPDPSGRRWARLGFLAKEEASDLRSACADPSSIDARLDDASFSPTRRTLAVLAALPPGSALPGRISADGAPSEKPARLGAPPDAVWTTDDGRRIAVAKMASGHLRSVLAMLRRRAPALAAIAALERLSKGREEGEKVRDVVGASARCGVLRSAALDAARLLQGAVLEDVVLGATVPWVALRAEAAARSIEIPPPCGLLGPPGGAGVRIVELFGPALSLEGAEAAVSLEHAEGWFPPEPGADAFDVEAHLTGAEAMRSSAKRALSCADAGVPIPSIVHAARHAYGSLLLGGLRLTSALVPVPPPEGGADKRKEAAFWVPLAWKDPFLPWLSSLPKAWREGTEGFKGFAPTRAEAVEAVSTGAFGGRAAGLLEARLSADGRVRLSDGTEHASAEVFFEALAARESDLERKARALLAEEEEGLRRRTRTLSDPDSDPDVALARRIREAAMADPSAPLSPPSPFLPSDRADRLDAKLLLPAREEFVRRAGFLLPSAYWSWLHAGGLSFPIGGFLPRFPAPARSDGTAGARALVGVGGDGAPLVVDAFGSVFVGGAKIPLPPPSEGGGLAAWMFARLVR